MACGRIVETIRQYDIQAGLLRQDSLFLGLGKGGMGAVTEELECCESVGITDQRIYDEGQLKEILGDADDDDRRCCNYFANNRRFTLPLGLGKVIGKPILFSLSNAWAKFRQVDTLRVHQETEKEF